MYIIDDFFKPNDFQYSYSLPKLTDEQRKNAADCANGKLLEHKISVIYGHNDGYWNHELSDNDTHQAYIFNIKEIKKETCNHEVDCCTVRDSKITGGSRNCKYCGVELIVEWKAK